MVAPSDQRSPGWRAERRGMELRIFEPCFGNAVHCWRRDYTPVRAGHTEAGIIGHDQQNIGGLFGCTTRGAHQAFDCDALSLITPSNFGSGGGSCFPSIVVVAAGEPGGALSAAWPASAMNAAHNAAAGLSSFLPILFLSTTCLVFWRQFDRVCSVVVLRGLILPHWTDARRLHRGRHPIDYGEARPSAPSRGRTGRVGVGSRLEVVPIVCDPDVAGRINRYVGYHLDASALENVDNIARLRAWRMPSGVVAGQERSGTTPHVADPYVIIAIHVDAPGDAFGGTG